MGFQRRALLCNGGGATTPARPRGCERRSFRAGTRASRAGTTCFEVTRGDSRTGRGPLTRRFGESRCARWRLRVGPATRWDNASQGSTASARPGCAKIHSDARRARRSAHVDEAVAVELDTDRAARRISELLAQGGAELDSIAVDIEGVRLAGVERVHTRQRRAVVGGVAAHEPDALGIEALAGRRGGHLEA